MKRKAMEIDKHKIERREGRGGAGYSPASAMVRSPPPSAVLRQTGRAPCRAASDHRSPRRDLPAKSPKPPKWEPPLQGTALPSGPAPSLDTSVVWTGFCAHHLLFS